MCGIVGVFNDDDSVTKAVAALDLMQDRGKSGYGVATKDKILFEKQLPDLKKKASREAAESAVGHCLHALIGFVPQPIKHKGILVANNVVYNWKELDSRYKLDAMNDSDAIIKLIEKKSDILSAVDELDGAFAFAYWKDDKVTLCRDIFGVRPVWYSIQGTRFAFASERKALDKIGFTDAKELNPREILIFDTKTSKIEILSRKFYSITPEIKKDEERIKKELTGLFLDSLTKRIPEQEFGILFSGGVDSTLIAKVCKDLGLEFTCYTAALESETDAEDIKFAKKAAEKLGLKLKIKTIKLEEVEDYLKKVVPLIEDNNVVKVGVGLTFYVASQMAKKDNIRVMFSGLGSEELFAGYERHKQSSNVNNECLSGLLKIYERDLYRDDVIMMNNGIELRLPFLDSKLAEYSLRIPSKFKIDDKQNKKIIRKVAEMLGVPIEFSQRKKKAAQYGSNFDKAIEKLAKKSGLKSKSAYLDRFYSRNPVLGVAFSSGKDSAYAMLIMQKQNYKIRCLVTLKSKNPDSYMFHTPNVDIAELQAKAMNLPLIMHETSGEKEKELSDLKAALKKAKEEYGIEGLVTGALFSQYQRERFEKVCDELGLKIFAPLWHMDQEKELRQILKEGFDIIFSSIAAYGFDKSWLGRRITEKDVDKLVKMNSKTGINIAGEGGEFETLVLDGPMFNKKVVIEESAIVEENESTARFIVKRARLESK